MSKPNYFRLLAHAWRQIVLAALLGLVLALALSLVQPLQYASSVKLLITQTNPAGVDPYTAIKSTERIAQNLSEIVYTSSFFSAVMDDASIDKTYFPTDAINRRKKWQRTIVTDVSSGTGVMTVTAYHTDRGQATALAVQVARELALQAPNYFGFAVRVQVIDEPVPSRFFAKPNFVNNGAAGAAVGLLLGLAWVLWRIKE